jgi:hypothetical protein
LICVGGGFLCNFWIRIIRSRGIASFATYQRSQQQMGVWLEGSEGDLVAILGGVHEVLQTEVELGGGDFLAAFLFVGGGELFADRGKLHLGFLDGLDEFAAALGFF